ncbi:hypothetical protein [Pseudoalteromonas rubra]|uniref:hypothetical protein n=1 Tax=Pseudoalteromonas rubra TaxID=43658 RepID=UPI000F76F61B|nr:hypothetical protein [Pseudoalteromonas rubra]
MMNTKLTFTAKVLIFIFIMVYTIIPLLGLFDIWFNSFYSTNDYIQYLIPVFENEKAIRSLFSCIWGAALGGAVLAIISFHNHIAVTKAFDSSHAWGFLLSPLLTISIGVITFLLLNGGFIFLTGNTTPSSESQPYGYTLIGFIMGYNWDVTIKYIEKLSKKIATEKKIQNNN